MTLILVSFESTTDAEKAANYLIDHKLAACVEIFPVTNFYAWKGEKTKASEVSGIIKTENGYFERVKEALEKLLPYEIPQMIEIEAKSANESYLAWVKEAIR